MRPIIKIMILTENNDDAVTTTTGKSYDHKIMLQIMIINNYFFSLIICLSYKKIVDVSVK